MSDQDILLKEIIALKTKLRILSIEHWFNKELFTLVWWVQLVIVAISIIVWLRFVNKSRILEIALFGLFISTSTIFLDIIGSEYPLWEYPVRLLPIMPLVFPVDFIFLPVVDMFIYQYFPKWKGFLIANIVASAILSFILEPLLTLLGGYYLITWRYIYSFPIYILLGISGKFIVEKIKSTQAENT